MSVIFENQLTRDCIQGGSILGYHNQFTEVQVMYCYYVCFALFVQQYYERSLSTMARIGNWASGSCMTFTRASILDRIFLYIDSAFTFRQTLSMQNTINEDPGGEYGVLNLQQGK